MTARPIRNSNIYLDIPKSDCDNCMYSGTLGFRKQIPIQRSEHFSCYLPNAAIGWKQPNGFFYPPSFHSSNLFFDNVDIRHYVIDALFEPGDLPGGHGVRSRTEYCQPKTLASYPNFFSSFTDIDRQTELNDDDGTLTGLTNNPTARAAGTISVNPADFFNAPVQDARMPVESRRHGGPRLPAQGRTPTAVDGQDQPL